MNLYCAARSLFVYTCLTVPVFEINGTIYQETVFKSLRNKRYLGSILTTEVGITEIGCTTLCVMTAGCRAANIGPVMDRAARCELVQNLTNTLLVDVPGWSFMCKTFHFEINYRSYILSC